ncbi:MAG: YfhL family 4Fe-4S dicluster ferredoxin [Polyangiaceae bacterium]|nr:YfhL family 4Fe-4S dicluster ferredoxin [Polyangiaceae bacterium]
MATYITADCINCGACERECPNDAIEPGDEFFEVDPRLCTECVGYFAREACQEVCPVQCCLPDPRHEESEAVLLQRALKLHPNDTDLRARAERGDVPSRFRR